MVYFGDITKLLGGTIFPVDICHSVKALRVYNCTPFPPLPFLFLLLVCEQNVKSQLPDSAVVPHILGHDGLYPFGTRWPNEPSSLDCFQSQYFMTASKATNKTFDKNMALLFHGWTAS